ncbi:neuroendocrine convertase 2-like [Saccoglossus kowalevskii]|uniref:PC3-like endoprotease variant B-like n=1 Tax=Saccoglossus kowalevskii TaxID=10224 RepID=A0ABM0MRG6_SACKO|nr:PREDICTED: PC3-like endoprotease variant B-like [Saccoglossus kowalevskii]
MKSITLLLCLVVVQCSAEFTNEWVVELYGENERLARSIADNHGFKYLQKLSYSDSSYHFQHLKESRRSKRGAEDLTELLQSHPMIKKATQQELKVRVKRDDEKTNQMLEDRLREKLDLLKKITHKSKRSEYGAGEVDRILKDWLAQTFNKDEKKAEHQPTRTRVAHVNKDIENEWKKRGEKSSSRKTLIPTIDVLSPDYTGDDYDMPFNDPKYPKQWYLHNTGQGGAVEGMDLNVMPAWKLGYTGKGIVATIVDDDSFCCYRSKTTDLNASYDYNNLTNPYSPHPGVNDGDQDPHPNDSPTLEGENDHGTKCGGEVGAEANNGICGVGVAYGVSLGGIRVLDGPITDAIEAAALSHASDYIDIYNCCWGPMDDGETFEGPGEEGFQALKNGVENGRDGKGSIYVWASGNGGLTDDDCAADGYVSSIYTIGIGAISGQGHSAFFIESCSPVMAVTLVGATHNAPEGVMLESDDNWVITTSLNHQCTEHFTGTSSAAPFATGSIAVVLEANPNLTWRDVQHIVVHGSNIPNPTQEGWSINGAGFHLNHKFGFGLLDVGKMVELAMTWEHVGPQLQCDIDRKNFFDVKVAKGTSKNITLEVTDCTITQLEHTQAHISFISPRRGDISIYLYSPSGTKSELLSTRMWDENEDGLTDWPFMTVHNWGETPNGIWTLEFRYIPDPQVAYMNPPIEKPGTMPRVRDSLTASLKMFGMTLYGTAGDEEKNSGGGSSGGKSDENDKETSTQTDNTAVNPDQAGESDPDTIVEIYNQEQASNEEIVVELQNLANDVELPPNSDNNVADGNIDTDDGFNGVVIDTDGNEISNVDSSTVENVPSIDIYKDDPDPMFDESLDPEERRILIKEMLSHVYTPHKNEDKNSLKNDVYKSQNTHVNAGVREGYLKQKWAKVENERSKLKNGHTQRDWKEVKRLLKEYMQSRE